MRCLLSRAVSVVLLASCVLPNAAAAQSKLLATHQDWQAYLHAEGRNRVCFVASAPQKKEPATAKRGEVMALVAHRPADKQQNVVSFRIGFPVKANSEVRVVIGEQPFDLFVEKETAWTHGTADDVAMVQAMIKSVIMTVTAESVRGVKTVDTYSLNGFRAAYKEITSACGLK